MDTLVVIPGLSSDHAVWERTMAALADGVSCLVGDTLRDDSLPGMARRILEAAPPVFWLAGVSMGGMVALEIIRAAPERVKGLALVDTNARPDSEDQKARRRMINAAILATDNLRALAAGNLGGLVHPNAPEDVRAALVEMTVRVGAETYVRQNNAVMNRDDLRPVLLGIAVPTKVIVGEQDVMTPPELSREIHVGVRGSELHVIPDCGHLPPIEKPEIMAALLRTLMSRSD